MGASQSARGSSSSGGPDTKKFAFGDGPMNVCGAPRKGPGSKTPTKALSASKQGSSVQNTPPSGLRRPPANTPALAPAAPTRQSSIQRQTAGAQFGNPNAMGGRQMQQHVQYYNRNPYSPDMNDSSSDSFSSDRSPEPVYRPTSRVPLSQNSLRMPPVPRAGSARPVSSAKSAASAPPAPSVKAQPKPAANGKYPKGTCDKCDGPHLTDSCPVYKKKRDDHPDAWRNFGRKTPLEMGKGGGNFKLKSARVVRQPGDGNCLFHSMSYGIQGANAGSLRREIANFIKVLVKSLISPCMAYVSEPLILSRQTRIWRLQTLR